jgi:hypothetical protein
MSRHVNKYLNKGEGRGTGAGKLQIGAGVWGGPSGVDLSLSPSKPSRRDKNLCSWPTPPLIY